MITVKTIGRKYDIIIERGCLNRIGELLNLNRKVMVVTDDGVPGKYADIVTGACKQSYVTVIKQGEKHKNKESYYEIIRNCLNAGLGQDDCIVALGGGIVGDMAGFAAATYKHGIEFYNIPTTCLSQVDSSIGGKTAINYKDVKNIIGCFYQPSRVIIDPEVLKTLSDRQLSNGLAEALKMSLTSDSSLFDIFEQNNIYDENILDTIIEKALLIKKSVVEKDERESGLRRILNFGHTIGHGIEAVYVGGDEEQALYHGECVALGMTVMCSDEVRNRLVAVMKKMNLPTECKVDRDKVFEAVKQDKKASANGISAVLVNTPGKFEMVNITPEEVRRLIDKLA